jgi:hypothetical protein
MKLKLRKNPENSKILFLLSQVRAFLIFYLTYLRTLDEPLYFMETLLELNSARLSEKFNPPKSVQFILHYSANWLNAGIQYPDHPEMKNMIYS